MSGVGGVGGQGPLSNIDNLREVEARAEREQAQAPGPASGGSTAAATPRPKSVSMHGVDLQRQLEDRLKGAGAGKGSSSVKVDDHAGDDRADVAERQRRAEMGSSASLQGVKIDNPDAPSVKSAAPAKKGAATSPAESDLKKLMDGKKYLQTDDLDGWLKKNFGKLGGHPAQDGIIPADAAKAAEILRKNAPKLRDQVLTEGSPYVDHLIEQLDGHARAAEGEGDL